MQTIIKPGDDIKDSDDEEDDFDVTTFDSGIELEKKNEKKEPKILPGWGSWSSELPKVKKSRWQVLLLYLQNLSSWQSLLWMSYCTQSVTEYCTAVS